MFKRKVTLARYIILLDKLTIKCDYSLREWLNLDKLLRRQKVRCKL